MTLFVKCRSGAKPDYQASGAADRGRRGHDSLQDDMNGRGGKGLTVAIS